MKRRLVIFDWDGTLIDSTANITLAIQKAFRALSLPVPTKAQARWVIGMSLDQALYHLNPNLSHEQVVQLTHDYKQYFFQQEQSILFDGIEDTLHTLRQQGFLLAIATGKTRIGLDRALPHLHLEHLFDSTKTADQTAPKPDPLMLEELKLELAPDQALMVGDTTHDIYMAHAAHIPALAVAYGAHSRSELEAAKPDAIITDPADLLPAILKSFAE